MLHRKTFHVCFYILSGFLSRAFFSPFSHFGAWGWSDMTHKIEIADAVLAVVAGMLVISAIVCQLI
jgi:hypothetical protein